MNCTTRFAAALAAFAIILTAPSSYSDDLSEIKAEVAKRHEEAVRRLQDWIKQVSIAAEDRGFPEGAEFMAQLAKEAGFQQATVVQTSGKPSAFATLDGGAKGSHCVTRTLLFACARAA